VGASGDGVDFNVGGDGVGVGGGGGVCSGSGMDDCEEVFKPVTDTSPLPSN
jgi:hypothetical protein